MHPSPEYWPCEILDSVMPEGGDYAVMLKAYYDASQRDTGTFCVAGIAFEKSAAKSLSKSWPKAFDGRSVHMTDFHNLLGDFKDCTSEQTGKWIKEGIAVLRNKYAFAVAISCDIAEVRGLSPKTSGPKSAPFLDGFKEAYPMCAHIAMTCMAALSSRASSDQEFALFFEEGDQYQGQSDNFIKLMRQFPLMKRLYRYRSRVEVSKKDAPLLQCADVLAWEWAKHVDRIKEGKKARPSLEALLADKEFPIGNSLRYSADRVYTSHLTGESLRKFFEEIEKYVLQDEAEIHPSVMAILNR